MLGRWPDGSSLMRNPYRAFTDAAPREQHPTRRPATNPVAQPAIAPAPAAGADAADNDFLFGTEDPQGLRCPFGAHIRRANPRDSLSPGAQTQIDISNRHRILRVGRFYVPEGDEKPGLMFMCLNGDIERQFEFVQQTWLGSPTFHGLAGERDPITSNPEGCPVGYTIPTADGPVRLAPISRFVTPRGGGYFFLPGKQLVEFLSG
jgi:deferrochelatase/peroxidase EfeB